jgi:hypothetical protein
VGDTIPKGLDDSRRFVAQQEGKLTIDPTVAAMRVHRTHTAGLDPNHGLAGSWFRYDDRFRRDWLALLAGDHRVH